MSVGRLVWSVLHSHDGGLVLFSAIPSIFNSSMSPNAWKINKAPQQCSRLTSELVCLCVCACLELFTHDLCCSATCRMTYLLRDDCTVFTLNFTAKLTACIQTLLGKKAKPSISRNKLAVCLFVRSQAFSNAARQELHYCQAADRTLPVSRRKEPDLPQCATLLPTVEFSGWLRHRPVGCWSVSPLILWKGTIWSLNSCSKATLEAV